jgi:hypothetical protein
MSLAVCAALNAALVIAKERSKAVTAEMQRITGHHWITHVVVVVIAFGLLGWIFGRMNSGQGPKMPGPRLTAVVMTGVMAGVFIVLGFYALAD